MSAQSYLELRKLSLEEKDLVILRTDRATAEDIQQLHAQITLSNPQWKGVIVTLAPDQDLNTLPPTTLLELHHSLKRLFEKWEKWAADFESKEQICVRCGLTQPEQHEAHNKRRALGRKIRTSTLQSQLSTLTNLNRKLNTKIKLLQGYIHNLRNPKSAEKQAETLSVLDEISNLGTLTEV